MQEQDYYTHGVTESRGALVHAHPQRDGQAEFTRVAGYVPRWFTHLYSKTVTLSLLTWPDADYLHSSRYRTCGIPFPKIHGIHWV